MARTSRIHTEYDDLKTDLANELEQVQIRMIGPAQDVRDSFQTAKKVIKKREDKKLDFERYQSRVDSGNKRTKQSDRDRAQLSKAQTELTVATEAYNAADDHLRQYLPPLLNAVWSLQPHFLAAQIQIQNSLLAHYYTMLHSYCQEEGFPSPSPPMAEIIRMWEDAFKSTMKEAEVIPIVASGKTARSKSFGSREDGHTPYTNGFRRPSQPYTSSRGPSVSPARPHVVPSPSFEGKTKLSSSPSSVSLLSANLSPPAQPVPDSAIASPSPSSSAYVTPHATFSPAGPNADYFSRDRQPSTTSVTSSNSHSQPTTPGGTNTALAAALAAKKKPPPPPPPPRIPSHHFQFVTALYDFGGQGEGDLVFREGDKIKVLKKTESTDDWWQGELRGVKGMFPANYVQV